MSEVSGRVKVGIVLPRPHGDPGEWLSDAVAFEAAGADALWMEHGAAPSLDPVTLAAALAALTYRSLLVVAAVPAANGAHALATAEKLSRGRLALITDVEAERDIGDAGAQRDSGDGGAERGTDAGTERGTGEAGGEGMRTVVRLG
ncbi:LLM class flavin-dependent oxidoreductase, partial [Nonomuraea sp. K274]